MVSKEDFNKVWSETSKEGILNQFYYEHYELLDLQQRIDKAIEYIDKHIRIDDEYPNYMEMLIEEHDELLSILRGEDNEES